MPGKLVPGVNVSLPPGDQVPPGWGVPPNFERMLNDASLLHAV